MRRRLVSLRALGHISVCFFLACDPSSGDDESPASETTVASESDAGSEGIQDPPVSLDCEAPQDLGGGYLACADGFRVRSEEIACTAVVPPGTCGNWPGHTGSSCSSDADCTDYPHGRCLENPASPVISCGCSYFCQSDADCGEGSICYCGPGAAEAPICIPADCKTGDDCESGLCGLSESQFCWSRAFALQCLDAESECRTDAECGDASCSPDPEAPTRCTAEQGAWACTRNYLCSGCAL